MPVESSPPNDQAVPEHVLEMARQAVKDFHECFWFRHREAIISDQEDVRLIIEHLRKYGGHRAWQRAQSIVVCL